MFVISMEIVIHHQPSLVRFLCCIRCELHLIEHWQMLYLLNEMGILTIHISKHFWRVICSHISYDCKMNNWRFFVNGVQIQLSSRVKNKFAVIYVDLCQDTYTDNIKIKELIASKLLRNRVKCKIDCKWTKKERNLQKKLAIQ